MKRIMFIVIACALACALATSCSSGPKPMYSWYEYDSASYKYLKNNDQESLDNLVKAYDKIIAKQSGTRGVVPPGVYADYGFVLIQANKPAEGKKMLLKESELYPESSVFVNSVIRMIGK